MKNGIIYIYIYHPFNGPLLQLLKLQLLKWPLLRASPVGSF